MENKDIFEVSLKFNQNWTRNWGEKIGILEILERELKDKST